MPIVGLGHTRALVMTLLCSLLLAVALACAPIAAPKPSPTPTPWPERASSLLVEPASGKAGAALKLKGSGLLPDEEVEVVLTVGDVIHSLGTEKAEKIVANKAGAFEVESGIPVRTAPGSYTIKARGNKGSVASFAIEVLK